MKNYVDLRENEFSMSEGQALPRSAYGFFQDFRKNLEKTSFLNLFFPSLLLQISPS